MSILPGDLSRSIVPCPLRFLKRHAVNVERIGKRVGRTYPRKGRDEILDHVVLCDGRGAAMMTCIGARITRLDNGQVLVRLFDNYATMCDLVRAHYGAGGAPIVVDYVRLDRDGGAFGWDYPTLCLTLDSLELRTLPAFVAETGDLLCFCDEDGR